MASGAQNLSHFFAPGRVYAVAGANVDPSRFGHKVFKWYLDRALPVTPINPKPAAILGHTPVQSLAQVLEAQQQALGPAGLALSVVTPPAVSVALIKEASGLPDKPVKAVWFQPGSYDNEVLNAAKEAGIKSIIAYEDCILVLGDSYLATSKDQQAKM